MKFNLGYTLSLYLSNIWYSLICMAFEIEKYGIILLIGEYILSINLFDVDNVNKFLTFDKRQNNFS